MAELKLFQDVRVQCFAPIAHAGVASDALKVAEYRSMLQLRSAMLAAGAWGGDGGDAAYRNFSRILSKVRIDPPLATLLVATPSLPLPLTSAHSIMHLWCTCASRVE